MPMSREIINAKRLANPEYNEKYMATRRAQKARHRARVKANPEKYIKAIATRRGAAKCAYARSTSGRTPGQASTQTLRNWEKSGWTEEAVATAVQMQDNRCAICNKLMTKPHVDHKHGAVPVPRALLCCNCNLGLGHFKDNPDLLRAAVEYLWWF